MVGKRRIRRRKAAGGITLLEVLISIFVLLFGMLGVAAMLPVGRFLIVRTSIADRSAACGRAGLREVKIRNMLNLGSRNPADPTEFFSTFLLPGGGPFVEDDGSFPAGSVAPHAFVIDPLGIARVLVDSQGNIIPDDLFPYPAPGLPQMSRVTLRRPDGGPMRLPAAERIFMWQDDLLVQVPDDPDLRPRQLMLCDGDLNGDGILNDVALFPFLVTEPNPGNPINREIQGNYSWMVTVCPATVEAGNPILEKRLYTVSVVVFYKRDFSPSERTVLANMLGQGYAGGDVQLFSDKTVEYLDVKENEWVMLCGNDGIQDVFKWYRVLSADAEASDEGTYRVRYATLAGPDWNLDWCQADTDGDGNPEAQAVLMDGVVGVYSETMELYR